MYLRSPSNSIDDNPPWALDGPDSDAIHGIERIYGKWSGTLNPPLTEIVWPDTIRVSGDVTIPSGDTLHIIDKAVVIVDDNVTTELIVGSTGTLVAQGTSTKDVKFRSSTGGTLKEKWGGIKFHAAARDACKIQYADIRNAKYGVYVENEPEILDSHISYSTVGIKAVGMAGGTIADNELNDNTAGLSLNSSSTPSVYDNTIHDNDGTGVWFDDSSPDTFHDNQINDNGNHGVYMDGSVPTFGGSTPDWGNDGCGF